MKPTAHPAKFTDTLLPVMAQMLAGCDSVLDPMAGTGKLHQIRHFGFKGKIFLSELQPKWAIQGCYSHTRVVVGNALMLPFKDGAVEAVCTSPTFGCRLADHHTPKDKSRRYGYQFQHGAPLHPDNSGLMQWGPNYREFHEKAWVECARVARRCILIDIKNHIRNGEEKYVSEWHRDTMIRMGWKLQSHYKVKVPGNRDGANAELRLDHHNLYLFTRS